MNLHGALSTPQGRVTVTWKGPEAGRISLDWIETGVPGVVPTAHKGFGHRVVMELVPQTLVGSSSLQFTADGLHWHLEFPDRHALSIQQANPT